MTETDITLTNDAFELLDPFARAGWTSDREELSFNVI